MSAPRLYPEIQKDNLHAVMAQIEEHPEMWDQSSWHCGTSHCFGGWAQVLSGAQITSDNVRHDARRWLGLTCREADLLFRGGNTLEKLREYVDALVSDDYGLDGYGLDGYDRDGYDRNGYDRNGYDRNGYDDGGRDRDGYDRNGYDRDGLDSLNRTREEVAALEAKP